MKLRAYLDNNATTRLAPEALAAMMPYLTDLFLNPSSIAGELFGVADAVSAAQRAVARLLGSVDLAPGVVLTSGASEANSWAVHAATAADRTAHLVATAIEHPSLLAALRAAVGRGATLDLVPPERDGRVGSERLAAMLRPNTRFVAFMAANNETGVVQPVAELAAAVRAIAPEALVHVDATQAVGRVPLDLGGELGEVDLLALSAHKFHGPKGVGVLVARERAEIEPLIYGAQEGGRRGGTPNPAAAAGLAAAADLAEKELCRAARMAALRDRFEALLRERVPGVRVNGKGAERLPNTSSLTVPGLDVDAAVEDLARSGICVASGAACSSGSLAPSHVLLAMGLSYSEAKSTFRVSLSRETTPDEIELTATTIARLIT